MLKRIRTLDQGHRKLAGLGLLLIIALLAASIFAVLVPGAALAANEPTYGSATVDGLITDWDTTNDFFANMYQAGNSSKPVLAKLYLRYDCDSGILYALVLPTSGNDIDADTNGDNHFIKFGTTGQEEVNGTSTYRPPDGTPPDFEFVNASGSTADGWEASLYLDPGNYTNLNVHAQIDNEETSAVDGKSIPLNIECRCDDSSLVTQGDIKVVLNNNTNGLVDATVTLYKDNDAIKTFDTNDTQQGTPLTQDDIPGPGSHEFNFGTYSVGHYVVDPTLDDGPSGTTITPDPLFLFLGPAEVCGAGGQSGALEASAPTAVTLAGTAAYWGADEVVVQWETAAEIEVLGFNVWRSLRATGRYQQVNGNLIPAQGLGGVTGAGYTFVDEDVWSGMTYYYKLESVATDGTSDWSDPIEARPGVAVW